MLTDLMPAASEEEKRAALEPEHEIVRRVQCLVGEAEVQMVFAPRAGYGLERPRLRDVRRARLRVVTSEGTVLRSGIPLTSSDDATLGGRIVLRAGERVDCSLSYAIDEPAAVVPCQGPTPSSLARSVGGKTGFRR